MKCLTKINDTCWVLDHRLNPMVSAMFAAMSSRLPAGGIEQRYREVVEAIAKEGGLVCSSCDGAGIELTTMGEWDCEDCDKSGEVSLETNREVAVDVAEEVLCELELHPIVQEFFDKFVGQYGHASILECVGQPAVYVEGVSPWTAYLSFDNPLVAGQEFSTRAVRRKDWPMCREAMIVESTLYSDVEMTHSVEYPEGSVVVTEELTFVSRADPPPEKEQLDVLMHLHKPHSELKALHESWLEVFEAEAEAWKVELRLPCGTCGPTWDALGEELRKIGEVIKGANERMKGLQPLPPRDSMDERDVRVISSFLEAEALAEAAEVKGREVRMERRNAMADCTTCNGTGKKYPWIKDPQAFRPALDRARWAIPSTISTGFCHTANPRVMGRVIQQGLDFSAGQQRLHRTDDECPLCQNGTLDVKDGWASCRGECGNTFDAGAYMPTTAPSKVWLDIKDAYEKALPGMAGMWSKEAVAGQAAELPAHLKVGFVAPGSEVVVAVDFSDYADAAICEGEAAYQRKPRGYLDPAWNQLVQVHIEFQCSWAVARDWHRHRTAFPWHLNIIEDGDGTFYLHKAYTPLSDFQENAWLLSHSYEQFNEFREAGDMEKAMLCLPFGTLVSMRTTMGLRDAVYMLELRANAHGANHEYEAQAKEALRQLKEQLGDLRTVIFPED